MLLYEFITQTVYHYTSIANAASIMSTNSFNLSPSIHGTESNFTKKGKYYYLSTARSRVNAFNNDAQKSAVTFKLDGNKLAQRYTGRPVNYFGSQRDETEDRILSDKPTIPALPYIKEVAILYHVTYHASQGENSSKLFGKDILTIIKICEDNNIPYYIYSTKKDFELNNKNASIQPNRETLNKDKPIKPSRPIPKDNWINGLLELLSDNETISYNAKSVLTDIKHGDLGGTLMFYYRAYPDKVHNVISIMKKLKINNVTELTSHIIDKWKTNVNI